MTKLNKRIEKYLTYFESRTRDNGSHYVVLKSNRPEELYNSVKNAHGDLLPDDWIYNTYHSILSAMGDYDISSIDDLEDYRHEIVDGIVDCYTSELTSWLNSHNSNTYYLTQAIQEHGASDGFDALALAQYLAINEIYTEVINLLT